MFLIKMDGRGWAALKEKRNLKISQCSGKRANRDEKLPVRPILSLFGRRKGRSDTGGEGRTQTATSVPRSAFTSI